MSENNTKKSRLNIALFINKHSGDIYSSSFHLARSRIAHQKKYQLEMEMMEE
jgi:hypothetical protein